MPFQLLVKGITYFQKFIHPIFGTFPTKTRLLDSSKWSHLQRTKFYSANLEPALIYCCHIRDRTHLC